MSGAPKRVFVGTLYSGEADYDACLAALIGQTGVAVTHHVVRDRDERTAHNLLWDAWHAERGSHDAFVKLDADVVLRSPTTLAEVVARLDATGATGLQASLHDHMTEALISGLNAYTSAVTFGVTGDDLWCDRNVALGNTRVLRDSEVPSSLTPAGYHCHHASELQGFRYGLHRAMKSQKATLLAVAAAYARHRDRVRGFALLGAVSCGKFMPGGRVAGRFNYTDEEFKRAFASTARDYDRMMGATPVEAFVSLINVAIADEVV